MQAAAVLREARRRAGLSQVDLARRARVAQPTISAYENGRRDPSWSTLSRLVAATGFELSVELVLAEGERELPDTTMGRELRRHRRAIVAAGRRRGVRNVRVFGSVARGEDGEASDVDLLVDVDDGVSLVALAGFEREVAAMLGRDVDAVPARSLKPGVAERVLSEAVAL